MVLQHQLAWWVTCQTCMLTIRLSQTPIMMDGCIMGMGYVAVKQTNSTLDEEQAVSQSRSQYNQQNLNELKIDRCHQTELHFISLWNNFG